jgi:hypothetical protein
MPVVPVPVWRSPASPRPERGQTSHPRSTLETMGLKPTEPDLPACPFRYCGEDATVHFDDLWPMDRLNQPAAILICPGHAERLGHHLRRLVTKPAPMEYRSSEGLGLPFTEWGRLPETLIFSGLYRPRLYEFRRRFEAPTTQLDPLDQPEPAAGPSSVQPPPSAELYARQLEWEQANPEPRHSPGQVCDCHTPWRVERGKGHCAARLSEGNTGEHCTR